METQGQDHAGPADCAARGVLQGLAAWSILDFPYSLTGLGWEGAGAGGEGAISHLPRRAELSRPPNQSGCGAGHALRELRELSCHHLSTLG